MSDTTNDNAGSSPYDVQRPPASHESDAVEHPRVNRKTSASIMVAFALLAVAVVTFGGNLLNPKASTTDGDYAGETIELLIPLAEGGGTDTWARFVGSELAREIPGKPGFSPVNEAGGEGISGTNRFAASAPADGTEILVSTASTVMPWVLGRSEVEYNFDRLTPILANGTGGVIYARTEAGVRKPEDLLNRDAPLKFGGISATGLDLTTLVAFDLLGVDVDAIFGFEGRGPVNLALQRGELDLDYQTTSAYVPAVEPLVKAGTAVPLMSFGQVDDKGDVVRDSNFPDIPNVAEVYETLHGEPPRGETFEAYKKLLALTYTYQKAMWVPGDTPPQAVELLRASAEKLSQSTDFNKEVAKVLGGYPLLADQQLAARISTAYTVDAPVREYIVNLLASDYQVKLE
jgi:tripartite-type tricarboxylate transporter receptor subunit TctC